MKNYLQTQRVSVPTAFVTKGRQRVKQHISKTTTESHLIKEDNVVYLKNGDEFEIELFNPTTNKILAKIDLNGKSLSSGIILRPGERVFLERYLDEARKFLFETYDVDINDSNALEAIKMNGIVEVKFYDECKPVVYQPIIVQPYIYTNPIPTPWYYTYTGGTTGVNNFTASNSGAGQSQSITTTAYNSCHLGNNAKTMDFAAQETGRVEKGSHSNQSFVYDSTTFNSYYSWKTTWKILPASQKAFVKEDLNVYCTSCGKRRRKLSNIFCSKCGTKF